MRTVVLVVSCVSLQLATPPLFNLCSCSWWTHQCPTHPLTFPAPQQVLMSMPRAWDGNVSTPGMAYMVLSVQATFTAPMVRTQQDCARTQNCLGLEIPCHASPFHSCGFLVLGFFVLRFLVLGSWVGARRPLHLTLFRITHCLTPRS